MAPGAFPAGLIWTTCNAKECFVDIVPVLPRAAPHAANCDDGTLSGLCCDGYCWVPYGQTTNPPTEACCAERKSQTASTGVAVTHTNAPCVNSEQCISTCRLIRPLPCRPSPCSTVRWTVLRRSWNMPRQLRRVEMPSQPQEQQPRGMLLRQLQRADLQQRQRPASVQD